MLKITKKITVIIILIFLLSNAFAAICGNYKCERGENKCNCPYDCGECGGIVPGEICQEYTCRTGDCRPTMMLNCCGNGICEAGETAGGCVSDCEARALTAQILEPDSNSVYPKGILVPIKVRVRTEFDVALNASLIGEGFFGSVILYDDGQHGDEAKSDGIYANRVIIPDETPPGNYPIKVSAILGDLDAEDETRVNIQPKLTIKIDLPRKEFAIGEIIDFNGTVNRKDVPASEDLTIQILYDDEILNEKIVRSNSNGVFNYSYYTSLLDPQGDWKIKITGEDRFGNVGLYEELIKVSETAEISYFELEYISPVEGVFTRGSSVQILVRLVKGTEEKGIKVDLKLPDGRTIPLEEVKEGYYSGIFDIPYDLGLGLQEIISIAHKDIENIRLSGSKSISIKVKEAEVFLEFLKPTKFNFETGDIVDVEIKAFYDGGEPINNAKVEMRRVDNNVSFELEQIREGIYSGNLEVEETDAGTIVIVTSVEDAFGNKGERKTSVNITGFNIFNWLMKRQSLLFVILAVMLLVLLKVVPPILARIIINILDAKIEKVRILEKNLQKHYFKRGNIAFEDYTKLLDSYKLELEHYEDQKKFWIRFIQDKKLDELKKEIETLEEEAAGEIKKVEKAAEEEVKEVEKEAGQIVEAIEKPDKIPVILSMISISLFGKVSEDLSKKAQKYIDFRLDELEKKKKETEKMYKIGTPNYDKNMRKCDLGIEKFLKQKRLLKEKTIVKKVVKEKPKRKAAELKEAPPEIFTTKELKKGSKTNYLISKVFYKTLHRVPKLFAISAIEYIDKKSLKLHKKKHALYAHYGEDSKEFKAKNDRYAKKIESLLKFRKELEKFTGN